MQRLKHLPFLIAGALIFAACEPAPTPKGPIKPKVPPPTMVVEPDSGPVGTEFFFEMSGFVPEETILLEIKLEGTDDVIFDTELQMDADGSGSFIYIPEEGQPTGVYVATAAGEVGEATARFEVLGEG